jgi:hypothetical protein
MMRAKYAIVLAVVVLSGAAMPQAAASETPGAAVRIYEAGVLAPYRYTVIKHLWAESWRSAFWVPTHEESGDAIAALQDEAASLGANGIVNLNCLNERGGWFSSRDAYFCYGNAIKLK